MVLLAMAVGANATTIYWTGDSTGGVNWNSLGGSPATDSNWATFNGTTYTEYGLAPTTAANLDVVFYAPSATNLTTGMLSASITINSFKFSSTSTSDVTIGGAGTLTIGSGGLTVESGAGALLLPRIAASADQTWTISSGKTVSFGLFDFGAVTGTNSVKLSAGALTTTSTGSGNLEIMNNATWKHPSGDVTKVVLKLDAGGTVDGVNSTGFSIGALKGDGGTFINFASGSNLDLTSEAAGTNVTYTGVISNAFTNLNVTGRIMTSGTMLQVLGNNNTYTGNTNIAANTAGKNVTLQLINVDNVLPTTTTVAFGVTNPASVTTGKLILGDSTKAVNQTVSGLIAAAASTPANGVYSIVGGNATAISTFTVNNATTSNTAYNGSLGGTGTDAKLAFTKGGIGNLTITGTSSYEGDTTINGGILIGANATSISQYSVAHKVKVNAGGTIGVQTSNGTTGWTSAQIDSLLGAADFADNTAGLAFDTTNNSAAEFTYATNITSAIAIKKLGANTLTLSGINSYTGDTSILAGTLKLSGSGTLGAGSGAVIFSNTTILDLNGTSQNVGNLSGTGTIKNTAASTASTLTIGNGNATGGSYGGAITDGGGTTALKKTGSGSIALTGTANSYSGGTIINGGTLLANNTSGSATGTGAVTVQTGGTLGGSGFVSGVVTVNSNGKVQAGNGTVGTTLTIANTLNLQDGSAIVLTLGASGTHSNLARTAGTWTFDNDQAFQIQQAGTVAQGDTFDNVITGLAADPGTTASWLVTTANWAGTFSYDGSGHVDLTVTAVPEPASLGLLMLGLPLLWRKRRSIASV